MTTDKVIIRASSRKYKKEKLYLGIREDNGKFITGQEKSHENPDGLTQEEMKNPDLIPPEKRKKYPRVITPNTYLTIYDGQKLMPEGTDLEEDALWGLIKLQPNIALSKAEHNPSIHDWYIEDPVKNEEIKHKKRRIKNKATSYIDDVSTSRLTTFLIYASNVLDRITAAPQNMSANRIYNVAYDIAEEFPAETVKFFENKDEEIKRKTSILELITYGIVEKRGNYFYDGPTYLGSNINELLDYLDNSEHAATRDKFFKQLHKKKTGSKDYNLTQEEAESTEANQLIKDAKIAYADENIEKATELLNKVKTKRMNDQTHKEFESFYKKVFDYSILKDTNDMSVSFDGTSSMSDSNIEMNTDDEVVSKVPNTSMSIEEIRSFLRSNKIKGWTKNMSKEELIQLFLNKL
jgi:hypothetical protein